MVSHRTLVLATVVTVASVGFTSLVLHWSAQEGRLAQDPTYDDVEYFLDGAQRLDGLYADGPARVLVDLVRSPPHAPLSTGLAMAAFAFFGPREWGPYALNALLLAALLALVCFATHELRLRWSVAVVLGVLCIPVCFYAVHEFRPDFGCALLTTAFCFVSVRLLLRSESPTPREALGAGLLLGAALVAKPSFFAHSIAMGVVVLGLAIVRHVGFRSLGRWPRGRAIRSGAWTLAGVGAVALFYFPIAGRDTLDYFQQNTRSGSDAAIWRFKGGFFDTLAYYAVSEGRGPGVMLGRFLWLLLILALLGLGASIVRRRTGAVFEIGALAFASFVSLAIMIAGGLQSGFFGLTYQLLLIFAALRAIPALVGRPERTLAVFGTAAFCIFSVASPVPWAQFPRASFSREGHSLNEALVVLMARDLEQNGPISAGTVFAIGAGEINSSSIEWFARKQALPLRGRTRERSRDVGEQLSSSEAAVFVVAAEPDAPGLLSWLPVSDILGPTLREIRSRSDFEPIGRVGSEGGYWLFRNRPVFDKARNRLALPVHVHGLSPPAGPFKDTGLPRVRWGLPPATTLELPPGPQKLRLQATALAFPGQRLVARLDGQELGRVAFDDSEPHAFSFDVQPGAQGGRLELACERTSTFDDGGQWTVVFRDIHLDSGEGTGPR